MARIVAAVVVVPNRARASRVISKYDYDEGKLLSLLQVGNENEEDAEGEQVQCIQIDCERGH